ncbi:retrovirus-related pol polyprotein from transposon TNT 1-94 [Tanacetum coccineum]|uniref:Retrovirus-related pol polyprotein from transposon TNT 1-94 n=1 Tax=Tanacetum coccineum TaxID=301880 RepID=A0ABQ5IXD4_9ASTR
MKVEESLNVTFDESPPPTKLSPLVNDDVGEEEDIEMPLLNNQSITGTTWVYRNKLDENGIVSRNKASLVAQGYNQQEGIDYDETYASITRLESIRILLAIACANDFKLYQMDVKSAFLNGFINEEVYIAQPLGFIDFEKPNYVYKLKKALYGLKQAPKDCNGKKYAKRQHTLSRIDFVEVLSGNSRQLPRYAQNLDVDSENLHWWLQDGLGGYDWSKDFEIESVNYALNNYDSEREKHSRARLEIQGYELALESLESRILVHEKNELAWGKQSKANTQKPKTVYESVNRDKVIIEDWNSDDEDNVSEVQTVNPLLLSPHKVANAGESSFVYLGGQIPINASTLSNADLPTDPNMTFTGLPKGQILRDQIYAVQQEERSKRLLQYNKLCNARGTATVQTTEGLVLVDLTIWEKGGVHQPLGFVDPAHPNKVYKERTATTPIESNKPLVKDEDGEDVDVTMLIGASLDENQQQVSVNFILED